MTRGKDNLPQLPKGWVWARLEDIINIRNGFAFESKDYQDNGVPLIRQSNLGRKKISKEKAVYLPKDYLQKYAGFIIEKGDIIVGMSGSIGRLCVYDLDYPALQNQRTGFVIFFEPETREYIQYYFETLETRLITMAKGVAVQNISATQIKSSPVSLPPLPEQHRIVAKIKELFTRLEAGLEALNKIKLQLKRYRQAVLKAAFEGRLPTDWREAHKSELEPASVLLEKIKAERAKSSKYNRVPPLDIAELPALPEGWVWSCLEELVESDRNAIKAGPFGSSLKKEFYVAHGYKIYGQEQVIRGDPFYGDYYIDEERYGNLRSCSVKPGDVLISLVGTIGKVLILPEDIEPGIINPRLVKISLDKRLVNNAYFKAYMESSYVRGLFSLSSHGGTMEILNLTILKGLPIPLPPLFEQHKIVEEIDHCFSIAGEIEKVIERSLEQSERLRQSILKRAFEGKLVLQDPNDEPAEKLLERIKVEKAWQRASVI